MNVTFAMRCFFKGFCEGQTQKVGGLYACQQSFQEANRLMNSPRGCTLTHQELRSSLIGDQLGNGLP